MGRMVIAFRERRPLLSVLIICALAWLPGLFTLPPLDRDESRFAQATKQMLETHDYIDIRLGTGARYEKPVGIYWLQAAATSVFGSGDRTAIWTYRIPSFMGALAAVAALFWLVRAFADADTAFYAALILGLSVLLMSEAKIAKTDAVLLACVTAAQGVMMRAYLFGGGGEEKQFPPPQNAARFGPPHEGEVKGVGSAARFGPPHEGEVKGVGNAARFGPPHEGEVEKRSGEVGIKTGVVLSGWAAFGLGILIKGPVIAIVCLTTAGALVIADRRAGWLKQLRPGLGIPLALAIVLPWAIAIAIASHGAFYGKSLGQDFALKLVGEQETHGAPPGYYALLSAITFWPGTLLLVPALILAWRRRRDPPTRFLLAWGLSTWLLFELVPTKLPHYVLPAYPALAALCAIALTAWRGGRMANAKIAVAVSLLLFVAAGIALASFTAIAPVRFGSGSPWWLIAGASGGIAAVIAVIPPALRGRPDIALARGGIAAVLIYAVAGFATVPRLNDLWLSPRMAAAVKRHARPADPPVIAAGYSEPSIQFLLGTGVALEDGAGAARMAGASGGLALVSDDQRTAFLSGIAVAGARAAALESITGLNYSRGRETRITLYRVAPGGG